MPILTLTTDWGNKDHYLAAFKGDLYTLFGPITLVDVSHGIEKFNIIQAAYLLKHSFRHFPTGTIHFIGLTGNEEARSKHPYVIVKYCDQYFIGHDSGVFSLLTGNDEKEFVRLPIERKQNYRDITIQLLEQIKLLLEGKIHFTNTTEDKLFELYSAQPTISTDSIVAMVAYIDSFGNAVLNIDRETFEKARKGRPYLIRYYKGDIETGVIRTLYEEVESGDVAIIYNQDDHLQVSINRGSAMQMLGVKINDQVRIEFTN